MGQRFIMKVKTGFLVGHSQPQNSQLMSEDCTVVTTLKADLSSIPKSSFQLISKSSGDYYKISYALEMRFSATISFKLIIGGDY